MRCAVCHSVVLETDVLHHVCDECRATQEEEETEQEEMYQRALEERDDRIQDLEEELCTITGEKDELEQRVQDYASLLSDYRDIFREIIDTRVGFLPGYVMEDIHTRQRYCIFCLTNWPNWGTERHDEDCPIERIQYKMER